MVRRFPLLSHSLTTQQLLAFISVLLFCCSFYSSKLSYVQATMHCGSWQCLANPDSCTLCYYPKWHLFGVISTLLSREFSPWLYQLKLLIVSYVASMFCKPKQSLLIFYPSWLMFSKDLMTSLKKLLCKDWPWPTLRGVQQGFVHLLLVPFCDVSEKRLFLVNEPYSETPTSVSLGVELTNICN